MHQYPKWFKGLIAGVTSYLLWLVGVGLILGQTLELRHFTVYALFSVLVTLVVVSLDYFALIRASSLFLVGLSIGFFEMFRAFIRQMTGWGDLIGVLSLMIWTGLGLLTGILVEGIYWLYRKKVEIKRPPGQ